MESQVDDEFEAATESPALVEVIRGRIAAEGAITFHDFMETALYHPQLGYYAARQPPGREGDYLTSPEVHPIFGALVGKQIAELWDVMGRPKRFDIVEQGAGTGRLAHDLLRWAARREPEFLRAARYRIVEISASLRREQERRLGEAGSDIEWLSELPAGIEGCVLSNELLDSFPVHRVRADPSPGPFPFASLKGRPEGKGSQAISLTEVYVSFRDGRFVEELQAPSTDRIPQYFSNLGLLPGEGCTCEVNLHAVDWMASVANALRRGYVLTFDYGYEARELYAPWRRDGTLMCFYRHNPSSDPYARIGKQDMTAHVDFTTLMRAGQEHGLATAGCTTQARFLAGLGIGAGVDRVAREAPHELEEYYARRRAVQELIDPAGLGRIRVLAQRKDVGTSTLTGFPEGGGA